MQFVVDGQPPTQNRSPAFAPDKDSDEVESMRVLTANFPAEYGRKLGGVVEIATDESVPMGWHGELDAAGGSFDHLSGTAGISFSTAKDRFSARASGLHSDRYLDPPVFQNYTNQGNSGEILAQYEREFEASDRLRVTFLHDTLGHIVPNDLVQQNQLIGPQRREASSTENGGQVYFPISPTLFLSVSGGVRESSFALRSNLLSTPVNRRSESGLHRGLRARRYRGASRSSRMEGRGRLVLHAGSRSPRVPHHRSRAIRSRHTNQFSIPGAEVGHRASFYVQDQLHYGHWNFSAGVRFDYHSFLVNKAALSPRLGISYFVPVWNLLLHAAYVSSGADRIKFRRTGHTNVFRRDFHNYSYDDVFLQTGVSFPISHSKARITGEEGRLEVPHWGRFSGFVSYVNQSGLGQGPITGGRFIGGAAQGVLTDTSKFAVSQDQRKLCGQRVRFQATSRLWFAVATQYGSGLPADLGDNTNVPSLLAQFGAQVVSRVNLERGRVDPNFSPDLAT